MGVPLATSQTGASALHGHIVPWDAKPFVARVTTDPKRPSVVRPLEVLIVRDGAPPLDPSGFAAVVMTAEWDPGPHDSLNVPVTTPVGSFPTLTNGDVVRLNPRRGELSVLYRRHSEHNSAFLTERCTNYCLMCSQPPRDIDDTFHLDDWLSALPLISRDTKELGVTGGEPTLLGSGFLTFVERCRNYLPTTTLHVLSNGRLFRYATFARALADIHHPDLTIAVPVLSDVSYTHDYLVQRVGAFDDSLRGLLNLARFGLRVEIRHVVQLGNHDRLEQFARFVALNLPFTSQLSIMALEPTGLARANAATVWVDPVDYSERLVRAVDILAAARVNTLLLNHQACVLAPALRPYAVKSISDYKNLYFPECEPCELRNECCGFFASATTRRSRGIRPVVRLGAAGIMWSGATHA